jgi:hypothetical protein
MTKSVYTLKTNHPAQTYGQPKTNRKNEGSGWDSLVRLGKTIGGFAVELYRYNNDPNPVFSNGGTRVVFRPDRIDLV